MKRYFSKNGVVFTYENNATSRPKRANSIHFYSSSLQFSEDVRQDERLSNNERTLLADIIHLVKKKGYCFCSNHYFAQLHHVSPRTITRWLKKLRELMYITIEIIKTDRKQIVERRIRIVDEIARKSIAENGIRTHFIQNYPYRQNCRKNIIIPSTVEKYHTDGTKTTVFSDNSPSFVTANKSFEWLDGLGYDPLG